MGTEDDTSNAAVSVRFLLRSATRAALGTLDEEGRPFVSLVAVATAPDGAPVMLLSDLARHTRHLRERPEASLLVDGTGDSGMDGPRVTLRGRVRRDGDEAARSRFVARHADAGTYAGFSDFSLWRFEADDAHLVAGFGRIDRVTARDCLLGETAWRELAAAEQGIVTHMNEDHLDALCLYATALAGEEEGPWRMTGIDAEGFGIARGSRHLRLTFDTLVRSSGEARTALVDMVKRARSASPA